MIEDVTLFEEAEEKRDLEFYENYNKKTHYQGVYLRTVDKRIQELTKENEAFVAAKETYTRKALRAFKSNHLNSTHNKAVDSLIEQINQEDKELYESNSSKNTRESYTVYIDKYQADDGLKIKEAIKNRELLIQADNFTFQKAELENTRNAYRNYLTIHPEGISKEKALKAISEIDKRDEDAFWKAMETEEVAPLQAYIDQFPDGNDRLDAERQIQLLKSKSDIVLEKDKEHSRNIVLNEPELSSNLQDYISHNETPSSIKIITPLNDRDELLPEAAENNGELLEKVDIEEAKEEASYQEIQELALDNNPVLIEGDNSQYPQIEIQQKNPIFPTLNSRDNIEKSEINALQEVLLKNDLASCEKFLLDFPNSIHTPVILRKKQELIALTTKRKRQKNILFIVLTCFLFGSFLVFIFGLSLPKNSDNKSMETISSVEPKKKSTLNDSLLKQELQNEDLTELSIEESSDFNYQINDSFETYHLVIESFLEPTNAEQLLEKIQREGFEESKIIMVKSWYIVSLEQYTIEEEAKHRKIELGNDFEGILIESYANFSYN